jgi:HAD superfamily hydrolase (TIGR01509 family)
MIEGVVFDLDGVLIESEDLWDRARRDLVAETGQAWPDGATSAMQGMSSLEWSAYLHDTLGVPMPVDDISGWVVARLLAGYDRQLPLLPGAVAAVERLGHRWPLALASSSNRAVIDRVLERAGLEGWFPVTVSSEEVARGKPAPDVYLEAVRLLSVEGPNAVAVEDSANGIRSARSAGLGVIAVPNRLFPPPPDVLSISDLVLADLTGLTTEAVEAADGARMAARATEARLDEMEEESFPASDPHSDWAGPPDRQ